MNFIKILESLGTGLAVGVVFSVLKLSIPAPTAWAGMAGVAGIFLGYVLVQYFTK